MRIADEIKSRVTTADAAQLYGIKVNRAGMCCCPFHAEKTPSCKIYPGSRGFHCFGCGKHGSVIDFVMELFGLSFSGAIKKLNEDFALGLDAGKMSAEQIREANERKQRAQKVAEERERLDRAHRELMDEYIRLDKQRTENKPASPDEAPNALFVEAIKKIPEVEEEIYRVGGLIYERDHSDSKI